MCLPRTYGILQQQRPPLPHKRQQNKRLSVWLWNKPNVKPWKPLSEPPRNKRNGKRWKLPSEPPRNKRNGKPLNVPQKSRPNA